MKTKVEYKDFTQIKFLSAISYSPKGDYAAFLGHDVDFDGNKYLTNIYLLNTATKEIRKLTSANSDRAFAWEDDYTLLFISGREKADKGHTIFFRINVKGGEAVKAFDIPHRVSKIEKLGENKYLLNATVHIGEQKPEKNKAEEGKDFYIFEELPYWFNGQGVVNRNRRVLMTYDSATGEAKQFTPEFAQVDTNSVSACKKYVAFIANEYKDLTEGTASLNLYNFETGELKVLVPQKEESISQCMFMGKEIFFTACTKNELNIWHNPTFYSYNLETNTRREIGFFDHTLYGGIGNDASYGGGSSLAYQNDKLYFLRPNRVNSELCVLENNAPKVLSKEPGGINAITVFGDKALIIGFRGMKCNEVYEMDLKTGEETQISTFNEEYYNSKTISPVEYTTFTTDYGVDLDCFVIKPVGYKEGHKYPCVLSMHGGPKAIFGGIYHHEMQAQANEGYFVIYTNPRGADGRGDDFANALIHNMGGPDYQDFMAFTDHCIKTFPDIDENRIAVCGGSYAGFMINWMIGHTDRYAAGASQRSIANYMSKGLTTDIGFSHNMTQLGSTPWENFDTMWDQSPLKYAFNAKTPTLFIQSDEDYRCWMSEPIQMFNVLKRKGVPTKMCLFHGENHELSRSGKPQNRLSRMEEIAAWFKTYVMEKQ